LLERRAASHHLQLVCLIFSPLSHQKIISFHEFPSAAGRNNRAPAAADYCTAAAKSLARSVVQRIATDDKFLWRKRLQ
jgi:hypothetical protein